MVVAVAAADASVGAVRVPGAATAALTDVGAGPGSGEGAVAAVYQDPAPKLSPAREREIFSVF